MAINVKAHPKFKVLYNLPADVDFVVCIGGRGGAKTYEVSKFATVEATIRRRRVAVTRDEAQTIRESILNEIFSRYDTANCSGVFNGMYEKTQVGIRDLQTGQMLVFTKGFRASSNEKRANMKSISEVDTALVEEAEDIRSFEKFNTFRDSIRTQKRLIIVILNTPDIQHWIVRRLFNLTPITFDDVPELVGKVAQLQIEGYWKLEAKQADGFLCIQTNYTDNEHLPESVVRDYRAYGDPAHHNYDLHYYLTAIKGFASSGRKGQILRKVRPIKLADYLAIQATEVFGLDFGTARPAGITGNKFVGNKHYVRELNYKPMELIEIGAFIARNKMQNSTWIADSAEPLSIGKLRRGWNYSPDGKDELNAALRHEFPNGIPAIQRIHGAIKGPGSVMFGLNILIGEELYFVDDAPIDAKIGTTNLWNEVYNYIYAVNKEGEPTNEPADAFNHLIDPTRYVAQSRGRFF